MKKSPKISIIVPVYNCAKYLKSCVTSLLSQTYQNLEIVFINDGSADDSLELLQSYAKSDSRIKVISQKNQGLSAARNTGLKNSTGEYVTFVDGDDQIEPAMIYSMVNTLLQEKADIVACSFKELYPSGKVVGFSHNHKPQVFDTKDALKAMLKEQGFMVSATMKLFPLNYFKDVKFPISKLHEDVGTTYKLIMKASSVAFIPDELYIYCHHQGSIVLGTFDDRKFDLITETDEMCDAIDKKYPELKNITNERRMRARFSILRQIPADHPRRQEILSYLKSHQSYITNNKEASMKDKIALRLAIHAPKLFSFSYRITKNH